MMKVILSVSDEGYYSNALYTLNLISTFLLYKGHTLIKFFSRNYRNLPLISLPSLQLTSGLIKERNNVR